MLPNLYSGLLAAAILSGGAGLMLPAGAGDAPSDIPAPPADLAPYFAPPEKLREDLGKYRSPLLFDDGRPVKTPAEWRKRREEILRYWHGKMGPQPPPLENPRLEVLSEEPRETFVQQRVRLGLLPGQETEGYLLLPPGTGRLPAALVVYYEPETAIGKGKSELRDFAYQLAKRGFAALSIGVGASLYYPNRIGVLGHSYGGKWALFAACLDEEFACSAWSDPGIVFDESRSNVNYWEPWYLGYDPKVTRKRGVITPESPRTGAYKELMAEGRDLHELHALMAPRPFLVSGGSEDPPERWQALNHTRAVNRLLGFGSRVAMTNRPGHGPTPESNEVLYRFFEWALKR
jgi:hypothetical protein